jgi:alpha-L-fucosidase
MMFRKTSLIVLMACTIAVTFAQKNYINESKKDKDKRMEWWRNARFGMFIHWGLYAVPAGEYKGNTGYGEWIMNEAGIPIPEYEKFAADFNPIKFNADDWVKTAADAGAKYIVITSKHHDGFSIFNSKVSDYDIMDRTSFKRDPLNELADACKKQGIKLCFYHSIMDWHHPDAKGEKFSLYRDNYLKAQLKELLTNYGPIGALWFDGEWIDEWTEDQGKDLYNYVRNLQPDIIINNRVGKGRSGMQGMNNYENAAGDFGTPEQEILNTSSVQDWESCMTMNDHWGYNKNDKNFKSTESLIWNLVDCSAKGGNYLLNVGPTAEGLIPGESVERMKEIGEWMKVNSVAIYKSKAWTHFEDNENIRYTTDNKGIVYVFVKGWPGNKIVLKKIKPAKGSKVKLLGTKDLLNWTVSENGITINLPEEYNKEENRPCKYVYVFQMKGKAQPVSVQPVIGNPDELSKGFRIFDKSTTLSMSSPEPGATIFYTIDGSEPGISSIVYTEPINLKNSCEVKAISTTKGKINSNVTLFDLRKSKFDLVLLSEVSPKYAASGAATLADGKHGSSRFADGSWLGFEGNDFEAIADLGSVKPIIEVAVSFLQSQNSWIFLPLSMEVYISDDNKTFTPAGIAFGKIPQGSEPDLQTAYQISINNQARFVKIKAKNTGICPDWHKGKNNKAWLFVDEIEIK